MAKGDGDRPIGFLGELVDLIRGLRPSGRPTNTQLAPLVPMSEGYLSEVVRGLKTPSPDMAAAIVRALGGDQATQHRASNHAKWAAEAESRHRGTARPSVVDPVAQLERGARRVRSGRLPKLADYYQARPEDAVLERSLDRGRAAVLVQAPATGVLAGMGGVGKTQIASAYAHRVWKDSTLAVAAWVDAGSRQKIVNSYSSLFGRITGQYGGDPNEAALDLVEWLQNTDLPWLVVLDGLNNPEDLDGLWPPDTAVGHLVVTTWDQAPSLWNGNRNLIPIRPFTAAESEAYLQNRLSAAPHLLDGAAELAETLGHLPLALAHAAAFMDNRKLTAQEYHRRFTDESSKLADLFPRRDERSDSYRHTVATTWSISVDRADGLPPEGLARPLLAIASLLSPTGVPIGLFDTPTIADHLGQELGRTVGGDLIRDALMLLHRFSLITVDVDEGAADAPFEGSGGFVYVHGLVQRVTREGLAEQEFERIARVAADALEQLWSAAGDIADTDLIQALRSNTETLDQYPGAHLMARDTGCHPLLMRVGKAIGNSGRPNAAMGYFQELTHRAEEVLGDDHHDTLKIRANAASWRGYARDWAGAFAEFDALLEAYRRIHGDNHLDTIATRASRASYQARIGDIPGAIAELEAVLEARQLLLEPFHPHTLTTRARLANWRGQTGDLAGAIAALTSLLTDYDRYHPEEVRDVFRTRASLATWRGHDGDAAAAATDFNGILDDQLRTYSYNHPETIATRVSLVYWYRAAKNWPAAKEAQRELVAEQRRILEEFEDRYGIEHPDTLARRASLIISHSQGSNRLADNVIAMQSLARDQERILGARHLSTLTTRLGLASLIGGSGDPAGAIRELHDLLDQAVQGLGPTHRLVLRALAKLATWKARAGELTEAARTLQILLARQKEAHAPAWHIATTLSNLVDCHQAGGNLLGVGETLHVLLTHQSATGQNGVAGTLRARLRIAVWRARAGQVEATVRDLRDLVRDHAAELGLQNRATMRARFELARWLWEAGSRREAEAMLVDLLRDQRTVLGANHRWVLANEQMLRVWRKESSGGRHPSGSPERLHGRTEARQSTSPVDNQSSRPTEPIHPGSTRTSGIEALTTAASADSIARRSLLEALALGYEPGVPRDAWLVMANALSVTVLVDSADIDRTVREARQYIATDLDEGETVYRFADRSVAQAVLSQAAQRTGLDGQLNVELRHRRVSAVLIADFFLSRYVLRNLPRHAAAGDCLHYLARNPAILDHVDLGILTEEVLRRLFGTAALPNEIAGALQVRHLLAGLPPADRAVVRAMVTVRTPRSGRRFHRRTRPRPIGGLPTPAWTVRWARQSRGPRHITLTGKPPRSRFRTRDDEIPALATTVLQDGTSVLAVGYRSGHVELWNIITGRRLAAGTAVVGGLIALAMLDSADVAQLAVVGDAGVQVWKLVAPTAFNEPSSNFDAELQAATTIRYRNRQLLALIDNSGHIILWDPVAGDIVDRSIARHDGLVGTAGSFPSRRGPGDCLVLAGASGVATTWETDPLRLTDTTIGTHKGGPITTAATIEDQDSTLLCTGGKNGRVGIWNPYTGQQTTRSHIRAHRGAVLAVVGVPTTSARDNIATGGEDDTVSLWDPRTGRRIGLPLTGHTARICTLAAPTLPDGRTVLISAGHDSSVRMWDLKDAWELDRSRNPTQTPTKPPQPDTTNQVITAITGVQLGEDREFNLVVGRRNGSIQRLNPVSGRPVGEPVMAHTSAVRMMVDLPMPDGTSRVATVGHGSTVKVWDFTDTYRVAESTALTEGEIRCITAVRSSTGDTLLAIGESTGVVRIWDPSGRRPVQSIMAHDAPLASMVSVELDYRTSLLITGGHDFKVRFWDPDSGQPDGSNIENNSNAIHAMTLLPGSNGPVLAAGGHENRGRLRLYDLLTRQTLRGLNLRGGDILLNTLATLVGADGRTWLVGVGRKSAIRIWRPDTGEEVHRLDIEGPIEASYAFATCLTLSTRRGLYLLDLTLTE